MDWDGGDELAMGEAEGGRRLGCATRAGCPGGGGGAEGAGEPVAETVPVI